MADNFENNFNNPSFLPLSTCDFCFVLWNEFIISLWIHLRNNYTRNWCVVWQHGSSNQSTSSKITPFPFKNADFLKNTPRFTQTASKAITWLVNTNDDLNRNNEATCSMLLIRAIFNMPFKCIHSSADNVTKKSILKASSQLSFEWVTV